MVNVPKARNTYCAKCNKHGKFKVCMNELFLNTTCWRKGMRP